MSSRTGDRFVREAVGACLAEMFRALFAHRKIGHNRFLPNPAQFIVHNYPSNYYFEICNLCS
jgi:hypothetical protein